MDQDRCRFPFWPVWLLLAAGPLLLLPAAEWADLTQREPCHTSTMVILTIMGMAVAVPLIPITSLLALVERLRRPCLVALAASVVYIGASTAGLSLADRVLLSTYRGAAERSAPVISAIEAHVVDHGEPPQRLADLVPDYLPAQPRTGIPAQPTYEYRRFAGDDPAYGGNPWMLRIPVRTGFRFFAEFIYLPSRDYTTVAHADKITPVDAWAYLLHD